MPSPRLALAVAAVACSALGCATRETKEYAAIADRPAVYDEAEAIRQWPLTRAQYVRGDVTAGPAYFPLRIADSETYETLDRNTLGGVSRTADALVFVPNLLLLPYQMVRTPPWSTVVAEGTVIPPTYHAAPPLPDAGETTREAVRESDAEVEELPPVTRPATVPATTAPPTLPDPLPPTVDDE